jgi:hypothetical protein
MSREEVMSKIRKLFALTRSSNEHEAALAASRAREMLSRHNLDMEEVLERGETSDELKATQQGLKAGKYGRVDKWQQSLFAGVARAFDCEPVIVQSIYTGVIFMFIGLTADIEAAVYTYQFLSKTIKRLCNQRLPGIIATYPRYKPNKLRYSYLHGAVEGVLSGLNKRVKEIVKEEDCSALMVVKEGAVKAFMESEYQDLKDKRMRVKVQAERAFVQGYRDGKAVKVPQGLGNSGATPGQLT